MSQVGCKLTHSLGDEGVTKQVCDTMNTGDQLVRQQAHSLQEEHRQSAGGSQYVSGKDCSVTGSIEFFTEYQLQSTSQQC